MTFRVRGTELVVDLNEDGFNLADVLAICDTGKSSKTRDGESTGEKGFGFKAVFGIASEVHIQSGLWSFSFKHRRHEDGIGMISPIWRKATQIPDEVTTRITLVYSNPQKEFLAELCTQFERQPETIVSFLWRLRKIRVVFEGVLGRDYEKSFKRVDTGSPGYREITSTNGSICKRHFYRSFARQVTEMPPEEGRRSVSTVSIWMPVSDFERCEPEISPNGQFISAYLPVCQIAQLSFLIQADFILPGSRQAVSDIAWNRKLRDGVARCFGWAAGLVASNPGYGRLRYQWLRFLPMSPMTGFWQPLCELIQQDLVRQEPFLSRSGICLAAPRLRSLPLEFLHQGNPLLAAHPSQYEFLSDSYDESLHPALQYLGVDELSSQEILDLVLTDLSEARPTIYKRPLDDDWHKSFARLLETLLIKRTTPAGNTIDTKLRKMRIMPVRDGNELVWWAPASAPRPIYFPVVVDDGHGIDRVQVVMPTDLGVAVLHPTAASDALRKRVYGTLGVQECSSVEICRKVEAAQTARGSKKHSDIVAHFELMFWFSYKMDLDQQAKLHAASAGNHLKPASRLFFQSQREFDASQLGELEASEESREHLLHEKYQRSTLSTRLRGGNSWESWLQTVAGVRWFPPLQDRVIHEKLHFILAGVLVTKPSAFLPMLQAHWAEEYRETCRHNSKLKQALKGATVLCRNGNKEELSKTWFPSQHILDTAREYGVEDGMPIVALPEAEKACELSDWSCLKDLDVSSEIDLSFYREVLLACSRSSLLSLDQLSELYSEIGNSAGLKNRPELKVCWF